MPLDVFVDSELFGVVFIPVQTAVLWCVGG